MSFLDTFFYYFWTILRVVILIILFVYWMFARFHQVSENSQKFLSKFLRATFKELFLELPEKNWHILSLLSLNMHSIRNLMNFLVIFKNFLNVEENSYSFEHFFLVSWYFLWRRFDYLGNSRETFPNFLKDFFFFKEISRYSFCQYFFVACLVNLERPLWYF